MAQIMSNHLYTLLFDIVDKYKYLYEIELPNNIYHDMIRTCCRIPLDPDNERDQ